MSACSILLVDDDPGLCNSLRDVLQIDHHPVEAVSSGREAIAACTRQPFDVMLLDIRLPDMSGLDLINQIEEIRPEIDILVITGNASLDSAALAVRRSTVGYLVKPLDLDRLLGLLAQIAQRKEVERENSRLMGVIQRAKRQWEKTFDAISDPIAIADSEDKVTRVNRAYCERFGTSFDQVIGKTIQSAIFGGAPLPTWEDANGRGQDFEERDDLAIEGVFEVSRDPVDLEQGSGTIYVIHDVTDARVAQEALRQRERELYQAQKMEAVGRLAGGVAHDFNNLLTIILSNAQLVLSRLHPADPTHSMLAAITRSAERSSLLIRQLLAFGRQQEARPCGCDLNSLISVWQGMLRRVMRENIDFQTHLHPGLPTVFADPVQLEQVVVNLLLNAQDAMPEGGTLSVETAVRELDHATAGVIPGLEPGSYVMLSVADSGTGIAPEIRDQIFEPFFTTKEKGTGLGLSSVYGIVEQSDGKIQVVSELGLGTTFRVFLPSSDVEAEAGLPPAEEIIEDNVVGQQTVLLVEDNEMIRELAASELMRSGLTVLSAADGEQAMAMIDGDVRIDILVTDIVLPKLGGFAVAERLRTRFPNLPILFLSGYLDGDRPTGGEFLEKPFDLGQLIQKVRKMLTA